MQIISILNTCFTLCLAFAILFFIISVVLFFLFDIRTIFNIRTGRAQAKTVKEMQEANTTTGRLRVGKQTQTSKLAAQSKSKPTAQQPKSDELSVTTEQLGSDRGNASAVVSEPNGGNNETQVLAQECAETSVLNTNADISANYDYSQPEGSADTVDFYFEIIKKVVCRDTDEVIR